MIVASDPTGYQGVPDTGGRQEGGSRIDEIEDFGREVQCDRDREEGG